jgi:hypothetical protein
MHLVHRKEWIKSQHIKKLCFIFRILGFWTLSIAQYSQDLRTQCFGNWICFCPQVRGETPTLWFTLLAPLERPNLNHWIWLTFSKGLYRVGIFPRPPRTETDPVYFGNWMCCVL